NLGSRRVVFDGTGAVVDRYRYSAWGVATQDSGTDKLASYTGKDYDASSLLYFNARYYDSKTGRFLSEDPARKGAGWYSYCDGNPVNATDPTGMEPNPLQQMFKNIAGFTNDLLVHAFAGNKQAQRQVGPAMVESAQRLAGKGADV